MYGEECTSWLEKPCMYFIASTDDKITPLQEGRLNKLPKEFGIVDIVLHERVVYMLLRGQDLNEILKLRNKLDRIFMEEDDEKGTGHRSNDNLKTIR